MGKKEVLNKIKGVIFRVLQKLFQVELKIWISKNSDSDFFLRKGTFPMEIQYKNGGRTQPACHPLSDFIDP